MIIYPIDIVGDFKDFLTKANTKVLSLDTETTSLNYYDLKMLGFSLCDGKYACYVDTHRLGKEPIEELKEMLRTSNKYLIFHNAQFDIKVLHKSGITDITKNIFCTMTAQHLLNEESRLGLKFLANKYLNVETQTWKEAESEGVSSKRFYEYATNDAIWTWQLHKGFNKSLYAEKLDRLFFEIEMPCQFVLADLHSNGIKFDLEECAKLEKEVSAKKFDLEKELFEMSDCGYHIQPGLFGGKEIVSAHNLGSSLQLIKILENKFGLKLTDLTETGKKSVSKPILEKYKDNPFVKKMITYSVVTAVLDKCLTKAPEWVSGDGRVRCDFNNCGTRTGRFSSSKPNMQNLAKPHEEFPVHFRKCFVSSEGKSLICGDYSGQELRVLAHVSGDAKLVDAFNNNKDPHLMTADYVFELGIPEEALCADHKDYAEYKEKFSSERYKAKNGINFPIIYGTTAIGISKTFKISEGEAQSYIDGFMKTYPEVDKAIRRCRWHLKQHGYVKSLTGRRRRLDPHIQKSYRQAFNFLIQSLSADMIRVAMFRMKDEIDKHPEWGAAILMTVHDEIVLEAFDGYAEEVAESLSGAMKNAMTLKVPLEVDIGIGKNYSEVK